MTRATQIARHPSHRLLRGAARVCLAMALPLAEAAPVTIIGTHLDVTYDDSLLGRYSAPTLVGDTLIFTTNRLFAESLNGQGLVSQSNAVSGVVVTAKGGFALGAVELAAFGDYRLLGAGSSVQVGGQLALFDALAGGALVGSDNLRLSAATPLNLADGSNHDWAAGAWVNGGSLASLGLRIDTTLQASTAGAGLKQAFIEQKFAGLQLRLLNANAVPLPSTLSLVLLALAAAGLMRRP